MAARANVARAQAAESRLLADAVDLVLTRTGASRSSSDLPLREVAAELATATRTSDRAVQRRMSEAFTLRDEYAATLVAWERGEVDAGHVSAIVGAGSLLDASTRPRYESLALLAARNEPAGRLDGIARAIAAQVDPAGADRRIRENEAGRRIRVYDLDDGMSRLLADLPAVLAHAIHDRLTQQARAVRTGGHDAAPLDDEHDAGARDGRRPEATTGPRAIDPEGADTRTIDQLRADVLCDTLLAGAPIAHGDGLGAIVAHVQVAVPLVALAGGVEQPALLAGSGPVGVESCRRLAGSASVWDRAFTDAATGGVLAVDRYRPSAELRRLLRARDEHCRFPGCRRPARRCDIDHTCDAALGGETSADNLSHLCRRHHVLKHQTGWSVRQRPGGVIEWRSPTGRRYQDRPPATVRFVPDAGPPSF